MASHPSVLVVSGGLSHEREVSLRSGRRVAQALRDTGCAVAECDLDAGLPARLVSRDEDVVWPLLHGSSGEDGSVRDVLGLLGVPYVGAAPAGCRSTWDKAVAKGAIRSAGLATPDWVALPEATVRELGATAVMAALVDRLGLPLVVKPARGGSALGVGVVRHGDDLPRAMVDCFAYGDVALVERFVAGVEVAVSVLDTGVPETLPPVEILPVAGQYDYEARYVAGRTRFYCPARLAPDAAGAALAAARTAHTVFGLRHLSRTDLIIDARGVPWFLEIDVAPGMTETSLYPQAVRAAGLDPGEVYRDLVCAAHRDGPVPPGS